MKIVSVLSSWTEYLLNKSQTRPCWSYPFGSMDTLTVICLCGGLACSSRSQTMTPSCCSAVDLTFASQPALLCIKVLKTSVAAAGKDSKFDLAHRPGPTNFRKEGGKYLAELIQWTWSDCRIEGLLRSLYVTTINLFLSEICCGQFSCPSIADHIRRAQDRGSQVPAQRHWPLSSPKCWEALKYVWDFWSHFWNWPWTC